MLALRRVAGSVVGRRGAAAARAAPVRSMGTLGEELKGAPSKVRFLPDGGWLADRAIVVVVVGGVWSVHRWMELWTRS